MTGILTTVVSLLVFSLVVLVHEWGHYIAAKNCGIHVEEFSIGMGPKLFGWEKNGTKYSIRALPIGGFNSMAGESGEEEEPNTEHPHPAQEKQDESAAPALTVREGKRDIPLNEQGLAFNQVSLPKRLLVLVAGAAMNLVLGFVLLLVLISGQDAITSRQIHDFTENAACQASGLQVDDVILAVNNRHCFVANDILYELSMTPDYKADFTVRRDGKRVEVPDVQFDTWQDEDGNTHMSLGFAVYGIKKTPFTVVAEAGNYTLYYARIILRSLVDLFTGRTSVNDLSGPVGIVSAINEAVQYGWRDVVSLMVLITINLGVFNLLPLPALDGGRVLLLAVEAVIRRPVPEKFQIAINMTGMALLLGLMLFATMQDILRLL